MCRIGYGTSAHIIMDSLKEDNLKFESPLSIVIVHFVTSEKRTTL